jgi:chemotaxis protein methyltransferase CheR
VRWPKPAPENFEERESSFVPYLAMSAHTDTDTLSARDMNRLCGLIYEKSGINIGPEKKIMLEGRLKRRMTVLSLPSYGEYCKYLFAGHDAEEMVHLIDVVSTNKTDFFREKEHFDLLLATALPELMAGSASGREFRIWSAGCSSGEEPYTMAIVLSEYARAHPGFRFRILATDISTAVLDKAKRAVFPAAVVNPVPQALQRKYFMRSLDREANLMRVVPELRELVEFRHLNLMEEFNLPEPVDTIFCRNVIIYFDRPTQERLFCKFARQLAPGGYVFVGHSESLHHMDVPLQPVAPAVYRKADDHHRN